MKKIFSAFLLSIFSSPAFSLMSLNALLMNAQTTATGQNSISASMAQMSKYDITATILGANGSNETFGSGDIAENTLTFPTRAGATDGDYVVIYDSVGGTWALGLDTNGIAQNTPTGAAWTAIAGARKSYCDISNDATRTFYAQWTAQLNANQAGGSTTVTAFNGAAIAAGVLDLSGATDKYVTFSGASNTGSAQLGTVEFQYIPQYTGVPADPQMIFSLSSTFQNQLQIFHNVDGNIFYRIYGDDTVQVVNATAMFSPVSGTTYLFTVQWDGNAGANEIFIDGVSLLSNASTFTRANTVDTGYVGFSQANGGLAEANFNIKNFSIYSSVIAPGNPQTAAQVAATSEVCLNALAGFSAVITTDDTAADGTMSLTQTNPGAVTNPTPHNKDDTGAGSITAVQNTAGSSSDVDVGNNSVFIPNHGFLTGTKVTLTTTGVLPGGLAVLTDYYLIVANVNNVKFATSQANALAGTAINITNAGSGTATIVVTLTIAGAIKLQKNNEPQGATPIWVDIASSSQNFSASGNLNWAGADSAFRDIRAVQTVTSGTVTTSIRLNAKE